MKTLNTKIMSLIKTTLCIIWQFLYAGNFGVVLKIKRND